MDGKTATALSLGLSLASARSARLSIKQLMRVFRQLAATPTPMSTKPTVNSFWPDVTGVRSPFQPIYTNNLRVAFGILHESS